MLLLDSNQISDVSHYATLFQLWAGICALCFYGRLFDKLVVNKTRKRVKRQLTNFKQRLHGLMSDEEQRVYTRLIDGSLDYYKSSLSHLGKLSFCYCLFVLFLSASEGYQFARLNVVCATIFYVCYSCYAMLIFNKSNWPSRMWTFLIPSLLMMLLFALPFGAISSVSEDSMGKILLLVLLCVPLFGIMRYYWENHVLGVVSEKVNLIERSFQAYSKWKSFPIDSSFRKIKAQKIREILNSNHMVAEKQDMVDEYFYSEVDDAFQLLRFKRYAMVYCHEKKKYVINNKYDVIFYNIMCLFIAFYIVMIIMCAIYL